MITWRLRGSNRTRFSSPMSARMKSNSSGPDMVAMSRSSAAREARLRSMNSTTSAGSASIGACSAPAGAPAGPASGSGRMKSPRSRTVCSASPINGSRPAEGLQHARATRRCGQGRGDVDEQPPARLGHRPRGRQLPQGEPERLHRVGHHLLVTHGDVDVVLPVVGHRNGEQRGDRPALDDVEVLADQAPFDVLRAAEVRFDPPAELHQPHDLRIRQHRLPLPLRLDRPFQVPPPGRAWTACCLAPTVFATTSSSRTV